MKYSDPVRLTSARAWRTYTGGSKIDEIHGILDGKDSHFPEEWIMSTVVARNVGREAYVHEGMSFLEDTQESLRDFIARSPADALGTGHVHSIGDTTGVLVKIIDAAERLAVQVHPNKQKAKELFHSQFGKTECWHILGGRNIGGQPYGIYMGFKEGITRTEWERCFYEQDIAALLGHMHYFNVKPGETYLIKGGVPHAIGQGCLLIEIQEPTDYTIRVERTTPSGLSIPPEACHQGIGFEHMFDCFDYDGISREEAYRRWCIPPKMLQQTNDSDRSLLVGYEDTTCFRLERYDITGRCDIHTNRVFCGLYILSGSGRIISEDYVQHMKSGDQFFIPARCDAFIIEAEKDRPISAFRLFGPKQ